MSLSDLDYNIEPDPSAMSYVGTFPGSELKLVLKIHICNAHEGMLAHPDYEDHRGLIDIIFYHQAYAGDNPIGGWTINPHVGAALIEGLQGVIPLALLNQP